MITAVLATVALGCLWGAWGAWRERNSRLDVGAMLTVGCVLGVSAITAL